MAFRPFSPEERAWLASQRLGRLATVSPDGVIGNAPVTYFVRADDTIDIGGMRMGETKKFRNVEAGSRVAFVVDIVDTSAGWHPIYLEIRGTAEAISDIEPPARWVLPRNHPHPPRLDQVIQPADARQLNAVRHADTEPLDSPRASPECRASVGERPRRAAMTHIIRSRQSVLGR